MPSRAFTVALGLIALITPLAVHLFFPVIPAVKVALGLSDARAQFTFSIALFGMAFANCKTAQASWFDGVGHVPFLEDPLRFNTELIQFANTAYH